jgi:carbonic anhydrase
MYHAIRANIRSSVLHLRQGSAVLEQYVQNGGLKVVGAEYNLESGRVDFLEGVSGD